MGRIKGTKMSDETKIKLSIAHMGQKAWNKGMKMSNKFRHKCSFAHKGHIPWNKGKRMSDEYRKNCSLNNSGRIHSEETKRKMSIAHKKFNRTKKGKKMQRKMLEIRWSDPRQRIDAKKRMVERYRDPKEREKHSQKLKENFQNHPERLLKCARIMNERYKNPREREKQSERMKKVLENPRIKKKMKKMGKKLWRDEKYIEKMKKSLNLKPNQMEKTILSILNKNFPKDWKYVGDMSFWINRKNPDFINCNGQKKIIEVFGNRWHNQDYAPFIRTEKGTKSHYKKYGFETLVLWSNDLRKVKGMEEAERKIIDFHNK